MDKIKSMEKSSQIVVDSFMGFLPKVNPYQWVKGLREQKPIKNLPDFSNGLIPTN